MVLIILFLVCLALGVFLWIKNKQGNREIERRNRLEEKQEELIEILRNRKSE